MAPGSPLTRCGGAAGARQDAPSLGGAARWPASREISPHPSGRSGHSLDRFNAGGRDDGERGYETGRQIDTGARTVAEKMSGQKSKLELASSRRSVPGLAYRQRSARRQRARGFATGGERS